MPPTDYTIRYPYGLNGQDIVGVGITALVARLDAVIKFARPTELPFIEREKCIYQRLGQHHDGILRFYGSLEDALILQYACNGSIRQYFAKQAKPVPLPLQLRWVQQITASIAFIHSKQVLHGDISCNNVFLDKELNAKLGDFAGSSIDGQAPLICYETSHEHPKIKGISIRSEVFALGSTFYEIMTGSKPYKELSDQEICDAYIKGKFPNLAALAAFNDIIAKCWAQDYASIDKLLEDVQAEVTVQSRLIAQIDISTILYSTVFPIALTLIPLLPVMFWVKNRK